MNHSEKQSLSYKSNKWFLASQIHIHSHTDTPIRSSQLRRGRTVHLEFSSSTATQLPSDIRRDLKLNCLSEHITSTLVTVSSCKSERT